MTNLKVLLNRLIHTPEESKLKKILLSPLGLLSILYGWVVKARVSFYRRAIYRTHSLPCKVVSVGNITLGGTGKTPFVCLIAEMIRKGGVRSAILSRGYKGKFRGPYGVVSDGESILMDAAMAGDEPYLLAEKLRGVPVIVGKERRVSGHLAIDRFHTEVLILDDGFQHLSLKRDVNLLLVDSSSSLANEKLFPRGNLREPLDQVVRADAIILTKAGGDDNIKYLKEKFLDFGSRIPFFRVDYQPAEIRVLGSDASTALKSLGGKRILAFSGIARPESFERTLRTGGAEVVSLEAFPDHYEYRKIDLDRLQDRAHRLGAEAMVTTEKDLVRLRGFGQGPIPLWALSVRHVFQRGDQPRFEAFLWERLGLRR